MREQSEKLLEHEYALGTSWYEPVNSTVSLSRDTYLSGTASVRV